MPQPLNPCPHCGAPGAIQHLPMQKNEKVIAECGNNIDCPQWPLTEIYETEEAAAAAWNRGEFKPVFSFS